MKNTDIIFIKVADNKSKLKHLCDCAKYHFLQGERILIAVLNYEVARYIEDLFWRMPEESFLPHRISDSPCVDHITITTATTNLNGAHVLFNLQTSVYPRFEQFATIYEFYDETHPDKTVLSQQHLEAYPHYRFLK